MPSPSPAHKHLPSPQSPLPPIPGFMFLPMESSPAATLVPPPPPSTSSGDPLLFRSLALSAGRACCRPMAFSWDIDAHVTSDPAAPAPNPAAATDTAVGAELNGSRLPAKGATVEEAPRRQWNLRDRLTCRDYRAEHGKLGRNTNANSRKNHGFSMPLTPQEIVADFVAITGRKPPRKPKKRPKGVQRQIQSLCPGSSLADVTRDRYKVNKNGGF